MSHKPSHSTEQMNPPQAQAEESIHWAAVIGVGAFAIVLFAVATLISYRFMNMREKELQPLGPDPIPRQIGQSEIGIVDQVPFDVTRAFQAYRDDRNARLESWGWVDRKASIVHMPIEEAMDRVVKEAKK
jgi:hypothetical protein